MIKDISYRDCNIRYREEGRGNTLILLHGFCESMAIWDGFIEVLSRKFHVITPDLLGHGDSDISPESSSRGEYVNTMEMQAEAVNEVLKASGVERCTLIGHSMGGYTALAFSELFPDRVIGLCLFHSSAMADTDEKRLERDKAIEAVENDKMTFLEGLIPRMFASASLERMRTEVDVALAIAKKTPKEGIIAALAGMRDRKDRQHILTQAKYPVLFIIGKEDILIPLDKILPQIVKPGHSEVLMLEGIGHMGFYEAAEKTLFAVERFVKETTQSL